MFQAFHYWFLMSFGFIFEFLFKVIGKQNPFSPVRLRKLVRPNLVKPSFLLKNKYKPHLYIEVCIGRLEKRRSRSVVIENERTKKSFSLQTTY